MVWCFLRFPPWNVLQTKTVVSDPSPSSYHYTISVPCYTTPISFHLVSQEDVTKLLHRIKPITGLPLDILTSSLFFNVFNSVSTTTVTKKVSNYIVMAANDGSTFGVTSAPPSYTVNDHFILSIGLISWWVFRSFSATIGQFMSDTAFLSLSVPQGSVLGPLLFLYMLPVDRLLSVLVASVIIKAAETQFFCFF